MDDTGRIDLAHAPALRLGRLSVRPATREVVRDDGVVETLEPRVMQVLVALLQAEGAILSRDDLIRTCWDGRIVGEDAINRVIYRLRRLADGLGEGGFRIDTITKVGYRLVTTDGAAMAGAADAPAAPPLTPNRRTLIAAGGAAAGVAAIGGAAWMWARHRASRDAPPSPEVAQLVTQARLALRQANREGQNQAIGLYQRVVALAPDYAEGWGLLGCAYTESAHYRDTAEGDMLRARGQAAGLRAQALDPDNAYAAVAIATARPTRGNWLPIEQAVRQALARHPRDSDLYYDLWIDLSGVGRMHEAAQVIDVQAKLEPPTPALCFQRIMLLWAANRMEDSDRAAAEAAELYPTHFANWFARYYVLMYSGRVSQALAMAADVDRRPSGIPELEIERVIAVAKAIQSRAPADIDAVMRVQLAQAHDGSGYAENTIQFASALGRLDDAFEVADAYFFGRGFVVPELRFTRDQGSFLKRDDPLTAFLFNPATAPMRADPRFDRLVEQLGLKRYWTESHTTPDYRR